MLIFHKWIDSDNFYEYAEHEPVSFIFLVIRVFKVMVNIFRARLLAMINAAIVIMQVMVTSHADTTMLPTKISVEIILRFMCYVR